MKRKTFYYSIIILSFFILWEAAQYRPSLAFLCPPPSKIIKASAHSLPLLLSCSYQTLKGILGGFFLALALSIMLASIMLTYKSAKDLLQPLFVLLQCTPMFTLAPLIVLWFGWGLNAVIIPTALTIFFPLTLTIYQGITATPRELLEQFILHGATKKQILIKLRLPYALPHIFSGLKIAIGSAGFAAIAGEWVASHSGLGILILESRRNYEMELMFAGLFVLSLLTLSLFQIVLISEKYVFSLFRVTKSQKIALSKCKLLCSFPLLLIAFPFLNKTPSLENTKDLIKLSLLLDWTPNPNHAPLYVGIAQGFFQYHGIDLHIQKNTDSSSSIPHILFEKVDMTLYHAFGIIKASIKGLPVQVVGRLIDSTLQGFIYRAEDSISNIQDLNNKVLGFCLNNSRDLSQLLATLKLQGVVPSKVKNVSSDLISPMLLKKIDFLYGAFYNIEEFIFSSLGMPTRCFLSDTYGMPTGPQLLICAKKHTKATEPEIIQAFQKALQKSIDFCKKHPEEAFKIYTQATIDIPKKLSIEHLQWEKTLPLFAQSQNPLEDSLVTSLVHAITQRYPELTHQVVSFSPEDIASPYSPVLQGCENT